MAEQLPPQPECQIIFLNGPSSSGKTSLAKELQETLLPCPFLHVGIDKVIGLMPASLNDWHGGPAPEGFSWKTSYDEEGKLLREIQLGPFAKKMGESLKEMVVTLANEGHFIIIDEVVSGKKGIDEWRDKLGDFKVIWIGIHSPLEVIEAREGRRGNRILGSGRHQYLTVHKDVVYDLDLNTHVLGIEGSARRIKQIVLSEQKNQDIHFQPMVRADVPLYYQWLEKEYIGSLWLQEGYEPKEAILKKIEGNGHDWPYLIMLGDVPIGYIQAWSWNNLPEKPSIFPDEPEQTYGMDLFIGEEEYLNKRYGTRIVKEFSQMLFEEKGARKLIIDPFVNNKQAIRCYEKAGFVGVREAHDGTELCLVMEQMALPDIQKKLQEVSRILGLGRVSSPITPLNGGAMHTMWRLGTEKSDFVVKKINTHITEREAFPGNYEISERIANHFHAQGIPAVAAIRNGSNYVVQLGEEAFITYPYVPGRILDLDEITAHHASTIGSIFAKLHNSPAASFAIPPPHYYIFEAEHWSDLIQQTGYDSLKRMLPTILRWNAIYRAIIPDLNNVLVVTHGDLHHKNVLWDTEGNASIVDWECVGSMNPYMEVFGYGLEWSGIIWGEFNEANFTELINAYVLSSPDKKRTLSLLQEQADPAFYGWIGHSVLAWTEFNLRRLLGLTSNDKVEIANGKEIIESQMIGCLQYLEQNERRLLDLIKKKVDQ